MSTDLEQSRNENKGLGASAADAADRVGGPDGPEPRAASQPSGRSPHGAGAFTPGPLKVVLTGTLTGVWAEVRKECEDPETGKPWERELCRSNTAYVRREDAYDIDGFDTFESAPEQYELREDGAEAIANANLWAAAPTMFEALAELVGFIKAHVPILKDNPLIEEADAALSLALGDPR